MSRAEEGSYFVAPKGSRGVEKLIMWFKRANQMARRRAEIILEAKRLIADMDPKWRPEADKVDDDLALILMRLGLIHLQAAYQGQMAAQNVIRGKQAHLN